MSHWTTSGRSRLKAKQNESFAYRARQSAAAMAKHNNTKIQPHNTEAPTPQYYNNDDESHDEPGKINPNERRGGYDIMF